MEHHTDEELMQLVRAKHRLALEEIYDRYVKLVYAFARKTADDEQIAKEIVQVVFIRLWTTQAEYRSSQGAFVNWILTITRNIAIDYIRQSRRHFGTVSLDKMDCFAPIAFSVEYIPEHVTVRNYVRDQISQACEFLSDSQTQLIHLVYWKGYTLREVAERNSEPIGTVKNRLHHALKILRFHLRSREEVSYD